MVQRTNFSPSNRWIKALLICIALAMPLLLQAKQLTVPSSDGNPVAYDVYGKGNVALVFIHGWSYDKSLWENIIPAFSKDYQVITLDLGGHGLSGTKRKAYTINLFGQDVAAVVKQLKLKKVILIGHSMGGYVMVETARILGNKKAFKSVEVLGLIAVDTLQNVEQKFTKEQLEPFFGPMRKDFKNSLDSMMRPILFAPQTPPALIEKIMQKLSSANPEIALSAWENMYAYDLPANMDIIKAPITCINAERFETDIEAGKRHSSSFDVKPIKALTHYPMLEDEALLNKYLTEAVNELISKKK